MTTSTAARSPREAASLFSDLPQYPLSEKSSTTTGRNAAVRPVVICSEHDVAPRDMPHETGVTAPCRHCGEMLVCYAIITTGIGSTVHRFRVVGGGL